MDYSNIILEMLDRIKALEREVAELKQKHSVSKSNEGKSCEKVSPSAVSKRDTTRYLFKGNVLLKNRLVLAVVRNYVERNPQVTVSEIKTIFDKSLQGSIGVIEERFIAEQRPDYKIRFFAKDEEIIHLTDGDIFVCSQWGILNIPQFIARANQLGFDIQEIKQ